MITEDQTMQIELEKTLPANAATVFGSLTDAEQLKQWFGPSSSYPVVDANFVAEAGRVYHITLRTPDGEDVTVFGKFLEVVPNERLKFTWQWKESEVQDFDTEVDITLMPSGDSTKLKLVHTGFKVQEYMDEHYKGWGGSLNRLDQYHSGVGEMLGHAIGFLQSGTARLKKTFEAVPDGRLGFTPSDTARNALQIVAHAAVSCHGFAAVIAGEEMPGDIGEAVAQMKQAEAKITTREDALGALDEGTTALIGAIGGLTPERFGAVANTPFGDFDVAELIFFPGTHGHSHAAQIDYLQTCWGDMDFHM